MPLSLQRFHVMEPGCVQFFSSTDEPA